MKLSEVFSGFFQAAQDAGIPIEADRAPEPQQQPPAADAGRTELEAQSKASSEALAAAQARIARLEDDAREQRYTALIERGPAGRWVGDAGAHRKILAALGDEQGATFQAYVAQQNATAEMARQSGLLTAIGSDRPGAASAWAQIESRARALMKEQPGLTFEAATVQVMDADPSLYRQYLTEQK